MQYSSTKSRHNHILDLHAQLKREEQDLAVKVRDIMVEAASRIDPFPEMDYFKTIPRSGRPTTIISQPGMPICRINCAQPPPFGEGAQVLRNYRDCILTPEGLYECYVSSDRSGDGRPVWEGRQQLERRDFIKIAHKALGRVERILDGGEITERVTITDD